jgi:isochorismate hydrolase
MKQILVKAYRAFRKSKLEEQIARFGRIVLVGVLATVATGSPVTVAVVAGLAEVAFRQVWPVKP